MRLPLNPAFRRRLGRIKRSLWLSNYNLQAALIRNSGLWNEAWFRAQYPGMPADMDVLRYFLRHGSQAALNPHALFDSRYYLETNSDVALSGLNPFVHYLQWGYREGRKPNPLFSDHWYWESNPDVAASGSIPLVHFVLFGCKEGRDPHPLFQVEWYRNTYADALSSEHDPLSHYLRLGEPMGYRPNPWFDPVHYRKQLTATEAPQASNLLDHFHRHGAFAGKDPGPEFSSLEYWELNADVAQAHVNPLEHYLRSGIVERRRHSSAQNRLDASDWDRLFGRLTRHEHRLLSRAYPLHGQGQALLIHADQQTPDLIAGLHDDSELDLQSASWDRLAGGRPDGPECLILIAPDTRICQDAILVALDLLRDNPRRAIYFDEIWKTPQGQSQLQGLPDWSPALHAAGGLSLHALYLANTPANWAWLHGQKSASTLFIDGLKGLQEAPLHVPLVGCQVEVASLRPTLSAKTAKLQEEPSVSIIVPTKDQLPYLRTCVEGLRNQTRYANWELIIVDNDSRAPETKTYLRQVQQDPRIRVIAWDKPFNFSQVCNVGARAAKGEYLCLLNNDIEIVDPDWLSQMVAAGQSKDCGAVGALLLYPDGRIQHAGVILGPGGVAANRYATVMPDTTETIHLQCTHEVSAVAAACMLTPRAQYLKLGGLDEDHLGIAFNDVDYCLRLREAGLYCRLVPQARLIHHESVSLQDHSKGRPESFADEVAYMQKRWAPQIARDPFHNLNLLCSKFKPTALLFANQREKWWRELQLMPPAGAQPDRLHPPLRWYVDSNQARVHSLRSASCATRLQQAITTQGLAVLILTKDRPEYIIPLLKSLASCHQRFARQGLAFRVFVGDTGSTDSKVLKAYAQLPDCVELITGMAYQFSRCNNELLERAQSYSHILFLNNDIEFKQAASSLLCMLSQFGQDERIGIVGSVLRFPDGLVQHEGIAAFAKPELRGFVYHPGARSAPSLAPRESRTCMAVTGAMLMIRGDVLRRTGGFDEAYQAECQDVDLCLAAARAGYTSVVVHAGDIVHFENGTREIGEENWQDRRRLMRRWHHWIETHWL